MAETRRLLLALQQSLQEVTTELSDAELLHRFVTEREEAAFLALLQRHGPMVLGICRALLAHEADAEDAFQATFLILAHKARSIRKQHSLASWLHGVAYRTARKARTVCARRSQHELLAARPEAKTGDDLTWREVRQVIHDELAAMAERHRQPLALCYLQGQTLAAAARELNISKSTLKVRLEQGRAVLRARLVRRGLTSAVVLVAAWPATTMAVPASLTAAMLRLVSGAPVPPAILTLKQGALNAMFLTTLKLAATGFAVLLVVGLSLGGLAVSWAGQAGDDSRSDGQHARQDEKQSTAAKPVAKETLRYDGKDFTWWRNQLLTELKANLRVEAMKAMGAFGSNGYAEEAAAALVEAVKGNDELASDEDRKVVFAAYDAVRKCSPPAARPLLTALRSDDKMVRRFAAVALRDFTSQEEVVKALVAAVQDTDPKVRHGAIAALPQNRKELVGLLTTALQDEDPQIQAFAAEKLGLMEKLALGAVPALSTAARSRHYFIRQRAVEALARIQPPPGQVMPLLIQALKDEDMNVRQEALQYMARIGPPAKAAVPALIEAYNIVSRNERSLLVQALGHIGPDAKEALPLLNKLLVSGDPVLREAASRAIALINK